MANEKSLSLFENPESWRLVTDNVMGGVSSGDIKLDNSGDQSCIFLSGKVSTANNGGFIQAAIDVPEKFSGELSNYEGVEIKVKGNNQPYNIHLRTSNLWFPWQSYRVTFTAGDQWQSLKFPFSTFVPYKTTSRLQPGKIKRLGVVAIGRDFDAAICVAAVSFYSSK